MHAKNNLSRVSILSRFILLVLLKLNNYVYISIVMFDLLILCGSELCLPFKSRMINIAIENVS